MTPDFDRAAIKASETLIKYRIAAAPVDPMPIIKSIPGVLVLSFAEMADTMGVDRKNLLTMFGAENQDAATTFKRMDGKIRYIVTYNQRLPFYMLQRALARELGHIILGHDGTRPEDVRTMEAWCFAYHFLCPRPLVKAVHDSGVRFTVEVLGNMTGCYERCLAGLRKTPGVHVPAELNQMLKEQFADYIENFLAFQSIISKEDDSDMSDFGTFMDNYAE